MSGGGDVDLPKVTMAQTLGMASGRLDTKLVAQPLDFFPRASLLHSTGAR